MIISIFKTSVCTAGEVKTIKPHLDNLREIHKWNFDLQDVDRILRIESKANPTQEIIDQLTKLGFECSELA